jgi:hypothetical protein
MKDKKELEWFPRASPKSKSLFQQQKKAQQRRELKAEVAALEQKKVKTS